MWVERLFFDIIYYFFLIYFKSFTIFFLFSNTVCKLTNNVCIFKYSFNNLIIFFRRKFLSKLPARFDGRFYVNCLKRNFFSQLMFNRFFFNLFFFNKNKPIKFLYKYLFKLNPKNIIRIWEFSLSNLVRRSSFAFSKVEFYFFLKNNLIFKNFSVCKKNCLLQVGDYVSFIFSAFILKYVLFRIYCLDFFSVKHCLRFTKNLFMLKMYDITKFYKNFNYNNMFKFNVPNYLEVDYSILSFMIIYTFLYNFEYFYLYRLFSTNNNYFLLNWYVYK